MPAPYALPNNTALNFSTGLDKLFVYVANQVPTFIPMMLFSLFMIIFLGGFFAQQRRTGTGDIAQWFSIAGWLTAISALLMFLIPDLINLPTVLITFGVAFTGMIWFYFTKDK